MNELLESINARIKSPVLGYYTVSFAIFNWKPLFYLCFQNEGALERFAYFDMSTTWWSLVIGPVLFATLLAVSYPWVNYIFLKLAAKPTNLHNSLQAESEHGLLLKKQELEDARAKLLSARESELVARAKRDDELNQIEDEDVRNKLKEDIDRLRKEMDELSKGNNGSSKALTYRDLMDMAADLRKRASDSSDHFDSTKLRRQAAELEEKASQIAMEPNADS